MVVYLVQMEIVVQVAVIVELEQIVNAHLQHMMIR